MKSFLFIICGLIGGAFIKGLYGLIWERIHKPILDWGVRFVSKFFNRWFDNIYLHAAKRPVHNAGILVLLIVSASSSALITTGLIDYNRPSYLKYLAAKEASITAKSKSAIEAKAMLLQYQDHLYRTSGVACIVMGSLVTGLLFNQLIISAISNDIITGFDQRITRLAPHITDEQEKLFKAIFASMKDYASHKELIELLDKMAAKVVGADKGKLGLLEM